MVWLHALCCLGLLGACGGGGGPSGGDTGAAGDTGGGGSQALGPLTSLVAYLVPDPVSSDQVWANGFGAALALDEGDGVMIVGAPGSTRAVYGITGDTFPYMMVGDATGWVPGGAAPSVIGAPGPSGERDRSLGGAVAYDRGIFAYGDQMPRSPGWAFMGVNGCLPNAKLCFGALFDSRGRNSNWVEAPTDRSVYPTTRLVGGYSFGVSVAVNGAAQLVAVGAPNDSGEVGGINPNPTSTTERISSGGAVAIFELNRMGPSGLSAEVKLDSILKARFPRVAQQFGAAIAMDGDLVAVGAPGDASGQFDVSDDSVDDDSAPTSGAVFVFRRLGRGAWTQEAFIKAPMTGSWRGRIGSAVGLRDGTLVIGDPTLARAYVYERLGQAWSHVQTLAPSREDPMGRSTFGASVAVHSGRIAVGDPGERSFSSGLDGSQDVIVGDSLNDIVGSLGIGAVYLFRRTGTGFIQVNYVKSAVPIPSGGFGARVGLSGTTLIVGAPREGGLGAVSVYR